MIDSQSEKSADSNERNSGAIVVLNKDLFFGVKIGNMLRTLGYSVVFTKTTDDFANAIQNGATGIELGIIDINAGVDWAQIAQITAPEANAAPLLAFGSHLDVDGLRAAKQAGVRRVVSNGDFHRDMVKLVQRYANQPAPATDPETPEGDS